jgi:hypothetical protein
MLECNDHVNIIILSPTFNKNPNSNISLATEW